MNKINKIISTALATIYYISLFFTGYSIYYLTSKVLEPVVGVSFLILNISIFLFLQGIISYTNYIKSIKKNNE